MGECDVLRDLKERGQISGCAAQDSEDRVSGGAPLLDCDPEFDCEGGVLSGWLYEEGGVISSHSNHSRAEN